MRVRVGAVFIKYCAPVVTMSHPFQETAPVAMPIAPVEHIEQLLSTQNIKEKDEVW